MSRLRKFNQQVLSYTRGEMEHEDGAEFFPLDIDEQDELIKSFEMRNIAKNERYFTYLGIFYLVCCGMTLFLATGAKRSRLPEKYQRVLLVSVQSIACSFINLRYSMITHIFLRWGVLFKISNRTINIINIVILVMTSWLASNSAESFKVGIMLHLPHVLFLISVIVKGWMLSMDKELEQLKTLRYKFKNA
ncbi:uncharacterized protein Ecym_7348 [Eremothecium cymbalariae DBVPG|uniref:Uncharacterized protein n=1 Tax=Eremothecium cymbalariae (strain CBS 270.75 / DBVPG 7215 / KCTC 17166 / NRRL Y-17582) TaxID=931890 RepID=G8JWG2_ERECY|nr:hypothetical protein Ecym_7348 [Eremothecium cymbalariae DBVPG\